MIWLLPLVLVSLSCSAAVLGGQEGAIHPLTGSASFARTAALVSPLHPSLPRVARYEAQSPSSTEGGSTYVQNSYYDDRQAGDYLGRLDERGGRNSGNDVGQTRSEGPVQRRRDDGEFISEQYPPAERLPPIKDYSHLEPPRVLPSREDLSTFESREKKSGKRQSLLDSLRPSNSGPDPGIPRENYSQDLDTSEWWRVYPKSYKPSRPTDKSESWENESTEEYEEVQPYDENKAITGDNNEESFAKMIKAGTSSDRADADYLPPLSSIDPPTLQTNPSKPDPIYLPAGKQPRNVLYSSLVDMINVAENLRVKRPSSTLFDDDDQYPAEGLAGDTSIDLTREDFVREEEGDPEEVTNVRGQVYPQVARIQDRGVSDDEGEVGGEDEWALPRMGPWDPADTPVATAVLGLVMLFLILVVVVMALRVHCRNSSKQAQEWIRHPMVMVTPSQPAAGAVQPILHHPQAEPIRIKAKGLLERRGSNTSLTLELGPESLDNLVTSRECTPEDFLLTAGNRLSRRALRDSFRDPRLLHAEFWDIPTNHPDRCTVPGSASKNRYRTVLPNEDTRVVLKTETGEAHPSDHYINANYIKGYDGEERAYIATQGPLVHTTSDLWRMVMQERARAVVMITRLKEKGRVKCEPYIPAYSAKYGEVTVTVKQVLEKNGYTIRQIHLKRGEEVHSTLHFWFTSWPDHKTPSSARHLLAMAAEVHATNKEGEGPAVVHCSAGIGRTGCFIGISVGVRQLLEEGAVDVLSIVCQMRLDRGGMVQTAEQYEFIHRALALYEASLPISSTD